MAIKCIVRSCKSSYLSCNLRFFCFPTVRKNASEELRRLQLARQTKWIHACNVSKLTGSVRICEKHFVGGYPADPWNIDHVDWVPSRFLHHNCEEQDQVDSATVSGSASTTTASVQAKDSQLTASAAGQSNQTSIVYQFLNGPTGKARFSEPEAVFDPCDLATGNYSGRRQPPTGLSSASGDGKTLTSTPEFDQEEVSIASETEEPTNSDSRFNQIPEGHVQDLRTQHPPRHKESANRASTDLLPTEPAEIDGTLTTVSQVSNDWQWLSDLIQEAPIEDPADYDWMIEDSRLNETYDELMTCEDRAEQNEK